MRYAKQPNSIPSAVRVLTQVLHNRKSRTGSNPRNSDKPHPSKKKEHQAKRRIHRLDLHHELMLQLLNGQFHKAPIPSTCERILDIGTGTGIWAIDMAIKFPKAEIVGTDLSPIQLEWAPENCRFEVDDAEREWVDHRSASFDFIHARNLAQSITDWPLVMSEAFRYRELCFMPLGIGLTIFRCCKPGGYVELSELSVS
jgi:SAM-dependent methyltransferase